MPNDQTPVILFGSSSGPKHRAYCGGRENLGVLISPSRSCKPWSKWWAADNDCFAHRSDPAWWCREGEANWLRMLDKIDAGLCEYGPMFVLLPDIVGDWRGTLQRYHEYLPEVRGRGLPFALALQDGAEKDVALIQRLNPHFAFVGGSRKWKWRFAEPFCQELQPEIKVHIGRASGPWRVRECIRIGADSCDGTGWMRYADKMLPGLWRILDGTDPQQRLEI